MGIALLTALPILEFSITPDYSHLGDTYLCQPAEQAPYFISIVITEKRGALTSCPHL
jgi:hypothetical protein